MAELNALEGALISLYHHVLLALHWVAIADSDELLRKRDGPVRGIEGEQIGFRVHPQKNGDIRVIGQRCR